MSALIRDLRYGDDAIDNNCVTHYIRGCYRQQFDYDNFDDPNLVKYLDYFIAGYEDSMEIENS